MPGRPNRTVLLIAYHFPPLAGSSGIQRTLRFAQHLPRHGWTPGILTTHARAYASTSDDQLADVPPGTVVRRAFALDAARHLSLAGRYPGWLARPDRWVSWRFDGVRQGLRLVRELRPAVLWSTYPIATAHLIGAELARRTGLPWVADFRDPMAQDGYPEDPATWKCYRTIEQQALRAAACSVFTSPSAAAEYARRYPESAGRIELIENGYDEEVFTAAQADLAPAPLHPGATTLLHSGIVYPSERDPTHLLRAVRRLHDAGSVSPATLRLRFRAPVATDLLLRLADQERVAAYVEVAPPIAYRDALREMLRADGLLVMQARNCNGQVPAKLYEYLRARRPVIGLVDAAGDTASCLRRAGIDALAPLDDAGAIADLFARVLGVRGTPPRQLADAAAVNAASRADRTRQLAAVFDRVAR
jgi:glycosyltransferase involved in cell wall biosynthesis